MTAPAMCVWLSFGLPNLNDMLKAKGSEYSRGGGRRMSAYTLMKRKYETLIIAELRSQGCIPEAPYKQIEFSALWVEKDRRRDPDNVDAGRKFILDAMVTARVLMNDGYANIASLRANFDISDDKKRWVYASWAVVE